MKRYADTPHLLFRCHDTRMGIFLQRSEYICKYILLYTRTYKIDSQKKYFAHPFILCIRNFSKTNVHQHWNNKMNRVSM